VPVLIGGTVIIEQIFNLPGMGRLFLDSIFLRDYTVVSGVAFLIAAGMVLINLIVDLTYAYLDPRIHYG
jgi:ABC-type dipeptide/oligopeptide/nickel transport system permease component